MTDGMIFDGQLINGLFVPSNNPKQMNRLMRRHVKDTAGKRWFEMPAPTITPELKKDLQLLKILIDVGCTIEDGEEEGLSSCICSFSDCLMLLQLRGVMDPKRQYKKVDSRSKTLPKYFQVGTVVESSSEFFTGRLTKKERKATIADELISDPSLADYIKRNVQEIEEHSKPAAVADQWKIKGKHSRKRAKQRRH